LKRNKWGNEPHRMRLEDLLGAERWFGSLGSDGVVPCRTPHGRA
jgi:hypothetical protein